MFSCGWEGDEPPAGGSAGCRVGWSGQSLGGTEMSSMAGFDRKVVSGGVITCSVRRPCVR